MAVSPLSPDSSNAKQHLPTKKSSRFGSAFKKVGHYLQNQAQEQSHSALYLSPPDHLHHKHTQADENNDLPRHLSNSHLARPYGVIAPLSSDETNRSSTSMTTNDASGPGIFQHMKRHQYASENIRQSYDVLIPPRSDSHSTNSESRIFVIFIHGGYFRDPKVSSTSFKPSILALESETHLSNNIAGYASLNYRLAPHPAYPQDPSTTPPYTLNNARWPQQPTDILSALKHIQSTYPASNRYILIGHSVGAALSFHAILRSQQSGITPPLSVVGVAGIYDFPRIHTAHPDYEAMTKNAMDPDRYAEASVALYNTDEYRQKWNVTNIPNNKDFKRRVILAASHTDGLVDWDQVQTFQKLFTKQDPGSQTSTNEKANGDVESGFEFDLVTVQGGHYAILENGELARSIRRAIEMVMGS